MQFRGEASYYINHIQFWLKKKNTKKKKILLQTLIEPPIWSKKTPTSSFVNLFGLLSLRPQNLSLFATLGHIDGRLPRPSDSRTVALFFRSASTWPWFMIYQSHNWEEITVVWMKLKSNRHTCICIDSFTRGGTWMSLISYRRHRIPQSSDAWFIEWTILEFRDSLSCQTAKIILKHTNEWWIRYCVSHWETVWHSHPKHFVQSQFSQLWSHGGLCQG